MSTARVERRLTAILAADVAGYSRLMGADEEGTLAQLNAHRRALVDPKIAEHRGFGIRCGTRGIGNAITQAIALVGRGRRRTKQRARPLVV